MEINQITYGNPTITTKNQLQKESYLDNVFFHFQTFDFPKNDSDVTKSELNQIVKSLDSINLPENENILKNYLLFDRNIGQSIFEYFYKQEIELGSLIINVLEDIIPIIYKLKYFFNRPRPNQLAQYYKLKLFPYDSKTSNSPSYPSEKVIIGTVLLSIIKEKHPEKTEECLKFMETIEFSRVFLGLNYQSDVDFSKEIAEFILVQPKIIAKYHI